MDAASPELKALLQRCRETPADDTPRLVLADWLDEQGDADRATFIRVQIALSYPNADTPQMIEWKALERSLLTAHFNAWIGDLRPILNGLRDADENDRGLTPFPQRAKSLILNNPLIKRGLIHCVIDSPSWLIDPGLRNYLRSPLGEWVEQVTLNELTPEGFERCILPAEYSGKISLNLLALPGSFAEFTDDVRARVSSPADRSHQDWQRFFECKNFQAVRSLETDGGFAFLRELGRADVRRLIELTVRSSEESADTARILATIPFESLSSLDFGFVDASALGEIVNGPFLGNLTKWNLMGSPIGDGGMIALCESPLAESLSAVRFPNTGIGDAGVRALVRSPIFAKMNSPSLNLMMNRIGDDGLRAIAESEHLLRYRELVLRENHCGDGGAAALAESEFAANLTYLDFWRNRIGDGGAVALAHSPHLGKIVDLCVKENAIGADGADALFERYGERAKV